MQDEIVEDCQNHSSGLLASRLAQRYEYSVLLTVPMLVEVHCIMTLRDLTLRRGNPTPASLEQRYQEIMQKDGLLDQIAKGHLLLVDENGLPVRMKNANTPKHSNLQVDRRFAERRVRVVTGSSNTEPSKLRRDFDRFIERDVW
jgi:transposase InsO family protein